MDFLPQDYQAPRSNSHYMRMQEGENRIRILSKPIFGWEDWTPEKKPVRYKMNEKPIKAIDPKRPMKHFWAFVVWNVNEEQIQIFQITQATIRASIEALCKDEDWGSPFTYDIKIIKKGEGIETEYSVNPSPHKEVSKEVLQAFKDRPINLEALFVSGDPFSTEWDSYTKLMPDAKDDDNKITPISKPQLDGHVKPLYNERISMSKAIELNQLLEGCSDVVKERFNDYLKGRFNSTMIDDIPESDYDEIRDMLKTRHKKHQEQLLEEEMANRKEEEV